MRQLLLLAATLTLLLHTDAVAFYRGSTITRNAKSLVLGPSIVARMEHLRGGATLVADDDVEEGEEEVTKSSLASSTKAKIASKKKSSAKKAVNKQLGKTTANALKPTSKKAKFRLPYLVRTLFNPVALLTMTKAYWASLFNLNYLQEVRHRHCDCLQTTVVYFARSHAASLCVVD